MFPELSIERIFRLLILFFFFQFLCSENVVFVNRFRLLQNFISVRF